MFRLSTSIVAFLLLAWPVQAQVFWAVGGSASDRIEAGNVDGTGQTVLWSAANPSGSNPWGIDFHTGDGRVYWSDSIARQINRINTDGTGFETLFTYNPASTFSLAIDAAANEVFFIAASPVSAIVRSDFAGNTSTFVAVSPTNAWLTLDAANRYLYWTETSTGFIRRANLDGTTVVENVVSLAYVGSPQARGIALDGQGGLYWVDNNTDYLYGVDLADFTGTPIVAGSEHELFNLRSVTNNTASTPNGLASDGQFLYWTEGLSGFRGIYRADLDGGNAGLLFAGDTTTSPLGVAAAPIPEPGTLLLAGAGLVGTLVAQRWRRRSLRQG
ncbi:MAG TPA: PEP-CTERM sorting domain-containing protein [Gemmatales bacterium]|nr:PEP-CTERM sorting domain-containing protein [Gemmatales bacterium]HMP58416.1 PEP-CTERM sorting domain-containing protein [Gemmatales bacterium]